MDSVVFCPGKLDESICHLRVVTIVCCCFFCMLFFFSVLLFSIFFTVIPEFKANKLDPDKMLSFLVSNLGLHCMKKPRSLSEGNYA